MNLKLLHGQFYGQVSAIFESADLTLTETVYRPDHKLPRHFHERAYFCFVLQGTFTESYEKRSRICGPSTLIFHPSNEMHSDHFHTEAHCFNVQISSRLHQQASGLDQPAVFQSGSLVYLATKLNREFREQDDVSALAIEGLALEMVATASRLIKESGRTSPPWIARAREMLHDNFSQRLTVASVAESVGVHPTHLAREFRRRYRYTMGEYVRQLRIDFACRQLSTSDMPLCEIAQDAGFFDQSHFARTFKLITGMSPAVYRKLFHTGQINTKR